MWLSRLPVHAWVDTRIAQSVLGNFLSFIHLNMQCRASRISVTPDTPHARARKIGSPGTPSPTWANYHSEAVIRQLVSGTANPGCALQSTLRAATNLLLTSVVVARNAGVSPALFSWSVT
jgi:hypothetical protein